MEGEPLVIAQGSLVLLIGLEEEHIAALVVELIERNWSKNRYVLLIDNTLREGYIKNYCFYVSYHDVSIEVFPILDIIPYDEHSSLRK